MKKFDSNDLEVLKGCFGLIGRSIPSSRSKCGYISATYVRMVVTGRVIRDNETTRTIIRKARKMIETLKG